MRGWIVVTPLTVMNTRAPAVLTNFKRLEDAIATKCHHFGHYVVIMRSTSEHKKVLGIHNVNIYLAPS